MIVIDSYDEDEEDEKLVAFIPLYLSSEMDLFRNSLVNLMQRGLE